MTMIRLQVDLTPAMRDLLDRLREESVTASSRAEVLRHAISVYAILHDAIKAGAEVHLVREGKPLRQLVLSPLAGT